MLRLEKNSPHPHPGFSRAYRLTTKADYTAVFQEQLKVSQGGLLALYKTNQRSYSRLGVIVSKSIVRKATARNRLKRTFRECFRLRKHEIEGFDLVILVRKGCPVDQTKLSKELNTLWQRLTACCHKP